MYQSSSDDFIGFWDLFKKGLEGGIAIASLDFGKGFLKVAPSFQSGFLIEFNH